MTYPFKTRILEKWGTELREVTTKTAYFEDVTEACAAAWRNFESATKGSIGQDFEIGQVTVTFQLRDGRWDYGHPTMYRMEEGHVDSLKSWWQSIAPSGDVLPPQFKPQLGCDEVNVVAKSGDGKRLFNYHVALIKLVEK